MYLYTSTYLSFRVRGLSFHFTEHPGEPALPNHLLLDLLLPLTLLLVFLISRSFFFLILRDCPSLDLVTELIPSTNQSHTTDGEIQVHQKYPDQPSILSITHLCHKLLGVIFPSLKIQRSKWMWKWHVGIVLPPRSSIDCLGLMRLRL